MSLSERESARGCRIVIAEVRKPYPATPRGFLPQNIQQLTIILGEEEIIYRQQ